MTQQIALVTGASRGLGKNAAQHLAKAGVGVVVTYVNSEAAAEAVVSDIKESGGSAVALQLDVSRAETFDAFAEALGETLQATWGRRTFDFLVNNAGTGFNKPFEETSLDEFDRMVNEHLKGGYFLTQKLLPLLQDGGRILNVSSGLARFSIPGYSAYAAMKGGVEVLTRYLAKELAPRQITVNVIAPGAIETDFGGGAVRDIPDLNEAIASMTALGRAGLPDDIGGAIASLLTGDFQWMTAQRIEVSGGMNL